MKRTRVEGRNEEVLIFKTSGRLFIITLVCHLSLRALTEDNSLRQTGAKKLTNSHYAAGLQKDTLDGGAKGLQRSIDNLSQQLPSVPINTSYIPAGTVSHRGKQVCTRL